MDETTEPPAGRPHPAELGPYADLMRSFVDGRVDAAAFEAAYLERYLADDTEWTSEEFDVLDGLFADVDDFVADAALRAKVNGLDEVALRARAATALDALVALGAAD